MECRYLMLPNIWRLQLSATVAKWNSPHLYNSGRSSKNLYSWLQMEMEQPRRASCSASTSYWCAVEGREWHLTTWGWAASDQLGCCRRPSTYRNRLIVLLVLIGYWGELRGMGHRAVGVISAAFTLPQSGETNRKINTPSQDSSLQRPPSALLLSVRVSPSSGIGTADKVGVRAHR